MTKKKKKIVYKLVTESEQLSIPLFNEKHSVESELHSKLGVFKRSESAICVGGKIILFSTSKERQAKEIIDLTLETTKSF